MHHTALRKYCGLQLHERTRDRPYEQEYVSASSVHSSPFPVVNTVLLIIYILLEQFRILIDARMRYAYSKTVRIWERNFLQRAEISKKWRSNYSFVTFLAEDYNFCEVEVNMDRLINLLSV